jgi:hypothetical protein
MLVLKEAAPSTASHIFKLSSKSVGLDNKLTFELTSDTYTGVKLNFTLESTIHKVIPDYSVSVHLFKNKHFSQKDIIDLRVDGFEERKGQVGHLFQLDALFQPEALQLNEHTFSYGVYALEKIFSDEISFQTKEVELTSNTFNITDFFDDDTILLVLCNEYTSLINNFSINNYLASLYLNGFITFNQNIGIELFNNSSIIETNYNNVKKVLRRDGAFVLRVAQANKFLAGENFVSHLFQNLIQKRMDSITRFIMLYQIIEIFISKIFHLKVQSEICSNLNSLTSFQLKEFLNDIQKERTRIRALFNIYTLPTNSLEVELKQAIIDFFVHVQDADYADNSKHAETNLTDVFYDYRNKLVHNYRQVHAPGIDNNITKVRMENINSLTEVLVAQIISQFHV